MSCSAKDGLSMWICIKDQLASEGASVLKISWLLKEPSGSALFNIKYVDLYQYPGSSNLIG